MEKISKEKHVEAVLTEYPGLTKIFINAGLPCLVCGQPYWGTIADLAEKYRINVDILIDKLNEELEKMHEKL
jgi:hypothetical protein